MEESTSRTEGSPEPKVIELMSTDLFTLMEDDSLAALEDLMKWRRIRHVPVVDLAGRLVGLITHRDFLRVAISSLSQCNANDLRHLYREIPVRQVMNKNVVTITSLTPLAEAARILFTNKFGCLPVIENDKLIGIITEADFVKAFTLWDARFTG